MQKPELSWMRKPRLSPGKAYTRLYQIIFLACTSIIVLFSSYGVVATINGHVNIVGAALVNVEIPPSNLFPFSAKPISYLMAAALGMTFSGFELAKPMMRRFSPMEYSILKMIAFVILGLAAYEILYNFSIWTAEISGNYLLGVLNPDVINNQFPNPKNPYNLVFATKLSVTIFAIAVYTFYIVRTVEKDKLVYEQP